jgi:hypothetical protein
MAQEGCRASDKKKDLIISKHSREIYKFYSHKMENFDYNACTQAYKGKLNKSHRHMKRF